MNPQDTNPQGQPPVDNTQALLQGFEKAVQKLVPQQQQQEPQMTQAEWDAQCRTFRAGQAHLDALFGDGATPEGRMAALNHIIQGAVSNATAMSNILAQHYVQSYGGKLEPDLQELRHMAESRFYDEVYDGHPGLKPLEPVLREMLPQFKSQADFPKADRRAQPEYVRNKFVELQKKVNPEFDSTGGQQQSPSNISPFPRAQQNMQNSHRPNNSPNQLSGQGVNSSSTAPSSGGGKTPNVGMAAVGF